MREGGDTALVHQIMTLHAPVHAVKAFQHRMECHRKLDLNNKQTGLDKCDSYPLTTTSTDHIMPEQIMAINRERIVALHRAEGPDRR
jgi:hypothetical protein